LRWSRADTYSGSGDAGAGGATPAYLYATLGRYSDPYGYRVADACRYATGNPNGDTFKVRCYTPFAHPDAPADGYNYRHTDTPADANAGSHAYANAGSHAYTDLASDDL
jgi:hypothetical protein